MQPLKKLLHRIKWDPEFGRGAFALGCYDRVTRKVHIVRFESATIDSAQRGTFSVQDETGFVVHIPFHRVRTVYRDGVIIWQRPKQPV